MSHRLFQLVLVLFLKPHRDAIAEGLFWFCFFFPLATPIVFPKWERQGRVKGVRERKESGEGEEQDCKREKKP